MACEVGTEKRSQKLVEVKQAALKTLDGQIL